MTLQSNNVDGYFIGRGMYVGGGYYKGSGHSIYPCGSTDYDYEDFNPFADHWHSGYGGRLIWSPIYVLDLSTFKWGHDLFTFMQNFRTDIYDDQGHFHWHVYDPNGDLIVHEDIEWNIEYDIPAHRVYPASGWYYHTHFFRMGLYKDASRKEIHMDGNYLIQSYIQSDYNMTTMAGVSTVNGNTVRLYKAGAFDFVYTGDIVRILSGTGVTQEFYSVADYDWYSGNYDWIDLDRVCSDGGVHNDIVISIGQGFSRNEYLTVTNTPTMVPSPAQPSNAGKIWVEGNNLCFICGAGFKITCANDGTNYGYVNINKAGSIWLETDGKIAYVDSSGYKRMTKYGDAYGAGDGVEDELPATGLTGKEGSIWLNNNDTHNNCYLMIISGNGIKYRIGAGYNSTGDYQ